MNKEIRDLYLEYLAERRIRRLEYFNLAAIVILGASAAGMVLGG